MTAPMVDYKIHWLKMMSVPESQAVVGRHDGINGMDSAYNFARMRAVIATARKQGWNVLQTLVHPDPMQLIPQLRL